MISIAISLEELGIVGTVAQKISGDGVARVAARGVRNRMQERFQELENTRPNKRGWPRQHLWSQLRRATQTPAPRAVSPGRSVFSIAVNHVAAGQIYYGGRIRPVNADLLTLPATAEAYGKRAREFNDLEFAVVADPDLGGALRPALVEAQQTDVRFGRKKKDGTRSVKAGATRGGTVFYWLTREVNQKKFPEMLPSEAQLKAAAIGPASEYVKRVTEGGR